MRESSYASGSVEGSTEVVATSSLRFAGVHTDPNYETEVVGFGRSQFELDLNRCGHGVGRAGENRERRVTFALRLEEPPSIRTGDPLDQTLVGLERGSHLSRTGVPQRGGPFDVCQDEGG